MPYKIKYKLLRWILLLTFALLLLFTNVVLLSSKIAYKNSSEISVSNILSQINRNISFKLQDISNSTISLYSNAKVMEVIGKDTDISLSDHNNDRENINNILRDITKIKSNLFIQIYDSARDVIGTDKDLGRFSSHRTTTLVDYNKLIKDPLFKELDNNKNRVSYGFLNQETWVHNNDFIVMLRMINRGIFNSGITYEEYSNNIDIDDDIGIIVCSIRKNGLYNIYKDSVLVDKGNIYLIKDNGDLISTSDDNLDSNSPIDIGFFKKFNNQTSGSKWIELDNKLVLVNFVKDDSFNYYLYSIQPVSYILKDYYIIRNIIFLISLITAIIIILLTLFIAGYFTKPIELLTFHMRNYIQENSVIDIEDKISRSLESQITSKNEIGLLADTFIWMLQSQKKLREEIVYRERIKREQQEKSRDYMLAILNSLPSMLIAINKMFIITQWNTTTELETGISASVAINKILWDVLPYFSGSKTDIKDLVCNEKVSILEYKNVFRDEQYYNISIVPLSDSDSKGAIIRIDNVTEKVKVGEVLVQSEKMLSVGGLAAGMAHEINNPLGGMMQSSSVISNRLINNINMPANIRAAEEAGTTTVAIKKFMELRKIPRMLSSIHDSGMLIKGIVQNMLSFSRKAGDISSSHDLQDVIEKSIELAATESEDNREYYFRSVKIIRSLDSNIPFVQCDKIKLQQVILNILRNASHAMYDAKTKDPEILVKLSLTNSGEKIDLIIKDNGPGMTEDIRKRVFEPFFTTKSVGLGTGLGLSVSYFIIKENHFGDLSVESSPGNGAKFLISLPLKQGSN
ncbi:MAG: ATP-binding protein [Spirochaetaceae bacterium]